MSTLVDFTRYLLSSNIYVEDKILKMAKRQRNDWVVRQLDHILRIDPLREFEEFRSEVVKLKSSRKFHSGMFELAEVGAESRYYGHIKALAVYAGIPYCDTLRLQLPYVEHGIRFQEDISPTLQLQSAHCVVSQGEYLRKAISKALPGIPQFCIGPYIHYAKASLTEPEIKRIREKLGTTLLVFPSHSTELESTSFDQSNLIKEVELIANKRFNNILFCFYWNDVDSQLVDLAKSIGAIPVSAGMRGDFKFISRLRSVLQFSSAAVGNGLGTHIGYSLHLGIPYKWIGINQTSLREESGEECTTERKFARVFSDFRTLDSEPAQSLFIRYWGGEKKLLTPVEMRSVFEITSEAVKQSHGWSSKFPRIYEELLGSYQRDESHKSNVKFSILSNALHASSTENF